MDYIRDCGLLVEEHLKLIFRNDSEINEVLKQSMEYSVQAGGKRLRPVLLLSACEAVGGEFGSALSAACAVEMIHTYSLIHDDLPAMDNDDYRRGKLTNHKVYGEAMAILAGDGLLTHAFYMLSRCADDVSPEIVCKLIAEMSYYAGPYGMVGGQAFDMQGDQSPNATLEQLEQIHRHKTGDLIVFALRAGGRIGGADELQLEALKKYGYDIGLAFQIQDDILDITGDESKLGKKTLSDEKLQKLTYPHLLGLEASKEKVKALTESGKKALLEARIPKPERLLDIADYLVYREF
ncbi:polyprenyl synthetase family protein [Marinicrinis lubricantis]|uniref:Polyprenyl synthetase family protein n=1 Tax=Marinicrinis lubricantis TaxID=2086470 RepID=A0ABW1ISD3_9BACL